MNESAMFSTLLHPEMLLPITEKQLQDAVIQLWGKNQSDIILKHYNEQADGANNHAFVAAVSDACINCPLRRWRERLLLEGGTSNVYQYMFDAMSMPKLGVTHAAELPLVFDHQYMLLSKDLKELSLQMVNMWSLFERKGNPNSGGVLPNNVSWPKSSSSSSSSSVVSNANVTALQPKVLLLRAGNRSQVVADPIARCFVWE
jgi:carboxylesterase type B